MLCSYLFYFQCLLFFYNAVLLWGISHQRLVKYKCKFNIFYVIFTFTWFTTADQESTYAKDGPSAKDGQSTSIYGLW